MVMAESERETKPESAASSNRLQWLRQRREALQEKLARKNNELKNLCIDEFELTGVLPPEIPLDPGESPPNFRRRVGTSFAYPQNLINKLKTNQAQEEQALELERQVQTGIAKAAYAIFNDPAESKAVRRKHRSIYQQSQRRLKELDTRLTFIRQGYGRLQRRNAAEAAHTWQSSPSPIGEDDGALPVQPNVKHRSKKPRPPLDHGLERLSNAKINCEKTVKVSNIDQAAVTTDWHATAHKDNGWIETTSPGCVNLITDGMHDLNDNSDMYILSDQCRTRTYSHGNSSDDVDFRHRHHVDDRNYRTISSGYDEDAMARRNAAWREQKRQLESYHYNQRQPPLSAYNKQLHKYHRSYHQDQLLPGTAEAVQIYPEPLDTQNSVPTVPRGRYVYYHGQYPHLGTEEPRREHMMPREHEPIPERVSLRRSAEVSRHDVGNCNDWIADEQGSWHADSRHPSQVDGRFGSIDRRKPRDSSSTSSLHRYQDVAKPVPPRYLKQAAENKVKYLSNPQHVAVRPERIEPPPARTLLRTQSLGSVETWHSGPSPTCPSPVVTTTVSTVQPSATAGSVHRVYAEQSNRDSHCMYRDSGKEWYETSMDFNYSKPPTLPTKSLEIPAESGRLRRDGDMNYETNLSSDKITADGRTIVHAGKYQPYKEVTKPFEMSDFYKYSTKFRKKVESGNTQGLTTSHHIQGNTVADNKSNNNNEIEANCDKALECRQQISNTHGPVLHRRIINSTQPPPVPCHQPSFDASQ